MSTSAGFPSSMRDVVRDAGGRRGRSSPWRRARAPTSSSRLAEIRRLALDRGPAEGARCSSRTRRTTSASEQRRAADRLRERRVRGRRVVVAEHEGRPTASSTAGSATSGFRRKNSRWFEPTPAPSGSRPRIMNPIAITSGGPSPNQDSPDSEFSGFERSMIDLTKMYAIMIAPTSGTSPDEQEVPQVFVKLVPEVDDTGEPGDAVVERGSRSRSRGSSRRAMFWLTSVRPTYQTIESDGHPDRRDAGSQVLRVDAREPLRERAVRRHRQSRSCRGQDRRLRRRRRGRQHRDDQQLVERRAEHVACPSAASTVG